MSDSNFSFRAVFFARNFVGHRTGKRVSEADIAANEINEIVNQIWEGGKMFIKREVTIINNEIAWHTETSPTIENIDKFMVLQNKHFRRNYCPSKLTTDIMRELRNREINVLVHVYSVSVSSQATWNDVKKKLIDSENRDRAGADNLQSVINLMDKLKQLHGRHLSAQDISWMTWANYIQAAPNHRQENLCENLPPPHLIRLFSTVPSSESVLVASAQNKLRIAQNINDGTKELLKNVRTAISNLKVVVEDIDLRVQALEDRCDVNGGLLNAVDNALTPQEDEFSGEVSELIIEQLDMDHLED